MDCNDRLLKRYKERIKHRYSSDFYNKSAKACDRLNMPNLLFDDFVVKGRENVWSVKDKQLFYVSNHVSLADFLLQGYAFWKYNLPIPRFIAGENLFHFPFGYFWKRCGAISLDRNGNGEYMRIFKREVEEYLLEGENLLVYAEGGRNYRGRGVKRFKTGLFGVLLNAVDKGRDIYVVPIKVNYDKRIEEKFLSKIRDYKEKRDACLKKGQKNLSRAYDLCYFWTDIIAYFYRIMEREKGNAYLIFGKAFNDFDKKKKHLLAERVREEIRELKI